MNVTNCVDCTAPVQYRGRRGRPDRYTRRCYRCAAAFFQMKKALRAQVRARARADALCAAQLWKQAFSWRQWEVQP